MIAECLVVEFAITSDDCPLAVATRETGARVDGQPPLLRQDGNALLHVSTPDEAVGDHLDGDDRIRYLHRSRTDDSYTYRCLSKQPCILHDLVDAGFLPESVHYEDGRERHVGAVVGYDVLEGVLAAAGDAVGVTLERVSTLGDVGETPVAERWNLTPAQGEAVRTAYDLGYFEVPRAVTAGEVADQLDISKTAFLERLHRAEAALFEQVLQ
jgi:predicted DNA binding protein